MKSESSSSDRGIAAKMRPHYQGGASHVAGSEQKPTREQIPAEILMDVSDEDQRENRHEWVGAE